MSQDNLNEVEKEFVDFMSNRLGKSVEYVTKVYIDTRNQFRFGTSEFKYFSLKTYDVNKLMYDDIDEKDLIATYKYHELIHAYRFLSYTFENSDDKSFSKKAKTVLSLLKKGDIGMIFSVLFRKLQLYKMKSKEMDREEPKSPRALAEYLIRQLDRPATSVVDYGCGPAYVSFEIAKQYKEKGLPIPTFHLVDIDCLMKDFVMYRFKKHGFPFKSISINENNLYPALPKHDLCIASEVMEHIKYPLKAFVNINNGLRRGGVLHGNYDDHVAHTLHISPDLSELRNELKKNNYKKVSVQTFIKQ